MDSVQHNLSLNKEGSSVSVLFWSSGGRIHYANSNFCHLVGYNVDELRVSVDDENDDKIGAHSLFHPDEMVKILKKQLDAVQIPSSYYLKTRLLNKWKQEIPVSCQISNLCKYLNKNLLF